MELLQLEYFEKVARFGSVSKAAAELCISQPSLSGAILRLEKELGLPLFERSHRRMILTSYGEYFLSVTREILRLLKASRLSFEMQLPLRVSVAFHIYNEEVFRLVHAFQSLRPEVEFDIHGGVMSSPVSLHSFDFVVCNSNTEFKQPMERLRVMPQGYYVVLPRSHPLAERESVGILELQGEPLCFLQKEDGSFEAAYQFCIDSGFIPKCVFTTNNPFYKFRYLSYGRAAGLVPSGWPGAYDAFPGLTAVPIRGYGHSSDIWFCWRSEAPLSEAARDFLAFVRAGLAPAAADSF